MLNSETIHEFRGQFRGEVLAPEDAGYEDARKVYNAMISRKPRLIAKCADPADVMTAITFAHANALRVSVRGGGHNSAGLGVCDDGLVIDLSKMSSTSTASAVKSTAKARNLGRSDKVSGYSCDLWEVVDTTMTTEICVASGLSMLALGLSGPFSMFAKGDDAWSQVLSHGFPLRMVMTDGSGKPLMKMEATRIDKKSVPDSEFAVPAGYTKMPSPI